MKLFQRIVVVVVLLISGCMLLDDPTRDEWAKMSIGKTILSEIDIIRKGPPGLGARVVEEKSYVSSNGHQVIAIDNCYVKCVPRTPYYDCIIYHEVDEHGIIVNAWPDPNSWKVRPKEERGSIHDVADPKVLYD